MFKTSTHTHAHAYTHNTHTHTRKFEEENNTVKALLKKLCKTNRYTTNNGMVPNYKNIFKQTATTT